MNSELEKKSKRLIILGISFFVLGVVFFIAEVVSKNDSQEKNIEVQEKPIIADSVLKNYPNPESFKSFIYNKEEIHPENILAYSGKCESKYVTFLIFPSEFDYRDDPTKAVVNRAIPCPENGQFDYAIQIRELSVLADRQYYTFVADQGDKGVWYNPR